MLTPAEAEAAIALELPGLPDELVPLGQAAGRVLRQSVHAERDAPPFDRVAMDGIAVASERIAAGARRLRIAGVQAAGAPPLSLDDPASACIEVMTGAVLPRGCDAVIPVEALRREDTSVVLTTDATVKPQQHVHRRASDARAGTQLLGSGALLRGPEIAVVASAGLAAVRVACRPRVAVVSTGDELVAPGGPILDHQVRRSNPQALAAALVQGGGAVVEDFHVPDDPGAIADCLRTRLAVDDVLVLSGGVSAGRFDHVPDVLAGLGVRRVFHKVAQRPGRPMWFGVSRDGKPVFALPGNPVSVLVCLARYVIPALWRMAGAAAVPTEMVALASPVSFQPALAWFLPVSLQYDGSGRTWALPCPTRGSGDFNSLAGTAGFIELPPGPATHERGVPAPLYRW